MGLFEIFVPSLCVVCGKGGSVLCGECGRGVRLILEEGHCPKCFLPYRTQSFHVCSDCMRGRTFSKLVAVVVYEGVGREVALALKFRGMHSVLSVFENAFLQVLDFDFDVVVPVPSFPEKAVQRGFCASVFIARYISKLTSKPTEHLLLKVKNTRSQFELSARERFENVRGAFAVEGSASGRRILLVDDIATTTATLSECSRILFGAGAREVFCFAFARGER